MKRNIKRVLILLLVLLIVIQFIRPAKNISAGPSPNDISTKYKMSEEVKNILKVSCYDCHSNNTTYPWYAKIQPVTWWLNDHITEGKRELNFSEFTTYSIRRQYSKLAETNEQLKKDEMPLKSYLLLHRNAKLDDQKKSAVVAWATSLRDSIKAKYPADSLKRNRN